MSSDSPIASTANQRLAEALLQRPLADYVAEKRSSAPKWPWRMIAEQLAADTSGQVQVSHETLRQWYANLEAVAS